MTVVHEDKLWAELRKLGLTLPGDAAFLATLETTFDTRYAPQPTGWVGATFQGTWVNTAAGHALQYRKEGDGVRVYGSAQGGAAVSIIFNLPAGFRPTNTDNYFPVVANGAFGVVLIDGGGDLYAWSGASPYRINIWMPIT